MVYYTLHLRWRDPDIKNDKFSDDTVYKHKPKSENQIKKNLLYQKILLE